MVHFYVFYNLKSFRNNLLRQKILEYVIVVALLLSALSTRLRAGPTGSGCKLRNLAGIYHSVSTVFTLTILSARVCGDHCPNEDISNHNKTIAINAIIWITSK